MKKGWQTKRLGDLFAFKNGRAFKKEEWTTKGLPIIRIQNLNNEDASFNYFAGEYSQDILVEPGDLLFSWSGTVGSSFGSHLWNGEPGVLNQHIFKIGLRETIAKRYAFHGLRYITTEIEQSVNGAVGLVHITKEKLNEFTLPVPPLAEQQRIVGLLDEAFEGLATAKANAEKNLQNARALFESHLQSVFTQRGEGSQTKTLEEACQFSNGLWKGEKPPFVKVGVIRNTNFTKEGTLDDSDIAYLDVEAKKLEKRRLQFGDIILEKSGGGPKQPVGRVALFDKQEGDFSFSNFTAALRVLDPDELDFRFVHRFLHWTYLSGVTKGMQSNSTGIRNLDGDAYKAIDISFPPLAEQQRIVAQLDALSQETQRLARLYERKHAALEALKKSLLHQAFSGGL